MGSHRQKLNNLIGQRDGIIIINSGVILTSLIVLSIPEQAVDHGGTP